MTRHLEQNTLLVLLQLTWVRLNQYCQLSGETKEAVHGKRKNGLWIEGVQWKIASDGKIWINLVEVELWVQYGNLPGRLRYRQASKHVIQKLAIASAYSFGTSVLNAAKPSA